MKSLLIISLLALNAEAAPRVSKPVPAAEPIEIKFSKSLNLDLQGQYFPDALSTHVNRAYGILQGDLSTSLKIGRALLFKFRPTGRWDPENKSESEQYWADVPEGYAQVRLPLGETITSYTQVGWNIFNWGVTDGFNPVDVVNARRFHDPLDSEKLGAFSITEKLDVGFALFEAIYIPVQRRSRLPAANSRWLPREIEREQVIDNTLFRIPATHSYYYRTDQEFDDPLRDNLGLRLGMKLLGIDFGGYYFDGAAVVPATNLRLTGAVTAIRPGQSPDLVITADPPIGLRPLYYRNKMYGGSMVFPLWELMVKLEAAHTKPTVKAPNLPVRSTEAVAELEHTFSGETQSLTVIGLFTWADHLDPEGITSSASFSRMFDRGVALGLRYQPLEKLAMEGFTIFDTKYGGRLHKLESTYTLSDNWKIYGGGEIFAGKISTPIGLYRKNDRVIAGVKLAL